MSTPADNFGIIQRSVGRLPRVLEVALGSIFAIVVVLAAAISTVSLMPGLSKPVTEVIQSMADRFKEPARRLDAASDRFAAIADRLGTYATRLEAVEVKASTIDGIAQRVSTLETAKFSAAVKVQPVKTRPKKQAVITPNWTASVAVQK